MGKVIVFLVVTIMSVINVNGQNSTLEELAENARRTKDHEALVEVGYKFWKEQKYGEAANCFRLSAELGNAQAQVDIGNCYLYGNGVYKDEAQAVEWYKKAAAQGYKYIYFRLGECYADGIGVAQDYTEALKWYKKLGGELGEMGEKYIMAVQNKDVDLL